MHPFQVLSEPIRRRIIEILAVGEHTAGMIADVITAEFSVTHAATSHHLSILRANEWVDFRFEWTTRIYWLCEDGMWRLDNELDWLRYLRKHRFGRGVTTPMLYHAAPFVPRPHPRAPVGGSTRGLRGVKHDPWVPEREPRPKRSLDGAPGQAPPTSPGGPRANASALATPGEPPARSARLEA